jgi:hypothetical protein
MPSDADEWSPFDLALITAARAVMLIAAPAIIALLYRPLLGGLLLVAQLFWIAWYESPLSDSYRVAMREVFGLDGS